MSEAAVKFAYTDEERKRATELLKKINRGNDICLRMLRGLPPEEEYRFHPNSFIPRKFLLNMQGWVRKELRPLLLVPPPDVAFYESDRFYRRAVTWDMVMERRRERQREQLRQKRSCYGMIERKPLYVWVFWCPGVNNFIFRGWWTYFVGHGREYRGGGYKGDVSAEFANELTRLFPLVEPSLFGEKYWDEWMKRFAKKYQRGTWCGKPQGKAPIWAEVSGCSVEKILGLAEWPKAYGEI